MRAVHHPRHRYEIPGSDWTELHPARRAKRVARRRQAGGRQNGAKEKKKEEEEEVVEDHFEYIVEAVRIVRGPQGTRQLNVRCSRH